MTSVNDILEGLNLGIAEDPNEFLNNTSVLNSHSLERINK